MTSPEDLVRMVEADVLLDAIRDRLREGDEDLRDGLADLVFAGPLRPVFEDEFEREREAQDGPPPGFGYP